MNRKILSILIISGLISFTILNCGCISNENEKKESQQGKGTNKIPEAKFEVTPLKAPVGTTFYVDASESNDLDGNIVEYEWDWTDDGIFDNIGVKSSHKYISGGNFTISLKVTDNNGATCFYSTEVIVVTTIPYKNVTVYFIDVGQGDSILIQTPENKFILIDTGDRNESSKVVNFLKEKSVNIIDIFIATHPDADHIGGADQVFKHFEVLNIYHPGYKDDTLTYNEFITAAENENTLIYTDDQINSGDLININSSIVLHIMHIDKNASNSNDASIVTRLDYGDVSFLFTGDISSSLERKLIDEPNLNLDTDILKVSNHGSENSTRSRFLLVSNPKVGVISVGENNNYNFPSYMTLRRLIDYDVDIYRTDQDGTVTITTDGKTWDVNTEYKVNHPPIGKFSIIVDGLRIDFFDQSIDIDNDTLTYIWDFGDGNYSNEKNPTHLYSTEGVYLIKLTVKDRTDTNVINRKIEISK